jgi:fructose-bisphosphate aldolase class II
VLHWDHASYEQILTAINTGFTSVMIDGSMLPFDENVAVCQRLSTPHTPSASRWKASSARSARPRVGRGRRRHHHLHQPRRRRTFVKETGVDSLAVAIGTYYGLYSSTLKPELKLDLLREIKEKIDLPLVLHGGSNNPDDEIAQAVKLGINKINISSDLKASLY